LAGNLPPLRCCSVGIILGERCGNDGGDDAPPTPACIRQRDAHEVDAAPLPAGVEHLANGGLDALCQQIDLSPARRSGHDYQCMGPVRSDRQTKTVEGDLSFSALLLLS
jgi:hypothetical protein